MSDFPAANTNQPLLNKSRMNRILSKQSILTSIETAYLPKDILLQVTEILAKARDVDDLMGLGSASRFFRSAIEASLFEKAVLHTPIAASRMHRETAEVGAFVRHLHVRIQSTITEHGWKMPPPAPAAFWKILSENFVNLTTLIIDPPQPRNLVDLDPPRYHSIKNSVKKAPYLPNLKYLQMPYNQIAMLKLLTHCPVLEEVVLTIIDKEAVHCYNHLARKQDRLVDVLDAHAPLPVQIAAGGGAAVMLETRTWSVNLQRMYYVVTPVPSVKRLKMQVHIGLRLEDAAEFARRLFPNLEELHGFQGGIPGHVTHITHKLLQQFEALSQLTSVSLVFAPLVNAIGQNLATRALWGVDEQPLAQPDQGGSSDVQAPSMARFSSRPTSANPNPDVIRSILDPLIVQLGGRCPKLRSIRHVYDDGINWSRDRRVWEFQGLIEGREPKCDESTEAGSQEVNVVTASKGPRAGPEGANAVDEKVAAKEIEWRLQIVPMPLSQGCDYI